MIRFSEKLQNKGPFFKRILFSYAFAVSLPILLLSTIIYLSGICNVRSLLLKNQEEICVQLASKIEERFIDIQFLTSCISMETDLESGTDEKTQLNVLYHYLQSTLSFADLLIYHSGDECFSAMRHGAISINDYFSFNDKERSFFNSYVTSRGNKMTFFPSSEKILWICPTGKGYTIIGVVDRQILYKSFSLSDCSILNFGALVLQDKQQQNVLVLDLNNILPTKEGQEKIPSEGYLLSSCQIGDFGWTLVSILPNEYIETHTHSAVMLLSIFSIALLTVGLLFAITEQHYRPIQALTDLVGKKDEEEDFVTNELVSISSALSVGNELNQQANSHRSIMRENLILRLINGAIAQDEDIEAQITSLNLFREAHFFRVIAMRYPDGSKENNHAAILDYVEIRYGRKDIAYAAETEADGMRLVIVVVGLPEEDPDAFLFRMLGDLQLFISFRLKISFCFGIGNQHSLRHLSTSYLQAVTAVYHCSNESGENMIYYENLLNAHLLENCYNAEFLKMMQLFQHSIRTANEGVSLETLQRLENEYIERSNWRYLAFRLTESIMEIVMGPENDFLSKDAEFSSLSVELNLALSSNEPEEHGRLMISITKILLRMMKRCLAQKEKDAKNSLIRWMQTHLSDPALSLNLITDEFGFSPSYWSKHFSEQFGINFNDWVWQSRLTAIKEQMINTDKTIQEIVRNNGYNDMASFSKKFKAKEGMTPGQYREIHRAMR